MAVLKVRYRRGGTWGKACLLPGADRRQVCLPLALQLLPPLLLDLGNRDEPFDLVIVGGYGFGNGGGYLSESVQVLRGALLRGFDEFEALFRGHEFPSAL